jgi:amidase
MARTAADVAMLLGAMTGTAPPPPAHDWHGTRVAWSMQFADLPFDPAVLSAVQAQRSVFESLGCLTEDVHPDFSGADAIFRTLRAQTFVNRYGDIVRRHRSLVKETVLAEVERGERLTAADIDAAERGRIELRRRVGRFMETYEFFVLPTTQVPPFDVSEPFVRTINGSSMASYIDWMKSCYYISAVGHPAISVPCGFTGAGLPVGLQIVGRDRDDWGVLALARAFETARGPSRAPWSRDLPASASRDA